MPGTSEYSKSLTSGRWSGVCGTWDEMRRGAPLQSGSTYLFIVFPFALLVGLVGCSDGDGFGLNSHFNVDIHSLWLVFCEFCRMGYGFLTVSLVEEMAASDGVGSLVEFVIISMESSSSMYALDLITRPGRREFWREVVVFQKVFDLECEVLALGPVFSFSTFWASISCCMNVVNSWKGVGNSPEGTLRTF